MTYEQILTPTKVLSSGLVSLGYAGRNKHQQKLWKFRCKCSREFVCLAYNAYYGHTQSCGCSRRAKSLSSIINLAYHVHKKNAKVRGYKTELSKSQFEKIIKQPCLYCGQFSIRRNLNTGDELNLNSVDRLDNTLDYLLSNCVPACFICQQMKHTRSRKEFLDHALKLVKFNFPDLIRKD